MKSVFQWFLYALMAFIVLCPLVISILILIWIGEVLR